MLGWISPPLAETADRFFPDDSAVEQRSRETTRTGKSRRKVLVVDDEHLVADTVSEILNRNGFEAVGAYSGEAALDVALTLEPDILLTDVLMPGMNGVQLAVELIKMHPALNVILFSGQTGINSIVQDAHDAGVSFKLLPKPLHPQELLQHLREY
jgi:DNA-binding NtrC family response regulator